MPQDLDNLAKIEPEIVQVKRGSVDSEKADQALFGDNQRQESLKQTLHHVFLWGVRVAGIAMIMLFVIRIYHLAAPDGPPWTWLDQDRLQRIDALLFSSFLGAFVSRYLHQALPPIRTKNNAPNAS